ncbi:hypothetical protein, partial [Mesorhizobium sp. M7A.F.Ca.CA.001.07.2.1]|uniref:hypothetical protein n=1 Tax=Mesorhizobium sp. M7A.F.Ca.CA.001.07.2.1 TaxID=2496684 RepID=UPI0019D4206C
LDSTPETTWRHGLQGIWGFALPNMFPLSGMGFRRSSSGDTAPAVAFLRVLGERWERVHDAPE